MCGIAGLVSTDDRDIDADRVRAMVAMLDHRGPDDRRVHAAEGAALGHARLSIIDAAGGAQPMSNEDGTLWIAFNGEIFNYLELHDDLVRAGHRFRTKSDTEVILHLFEERGPAAVEKLNGQWAFAIWNTRTRTLFLSRDRMGVRPLFYATAGSRLLFASEIKAIFTDRAISRELDPYALDNIFTFWTALPPRTPFRGVRALPPAHSMTWHDGRVTIAQYWTPAFAPCESAPRGREAIDATTSVLEEATRLRLRSDVPVGAYLSGGLDSSVITSLMTRVAGAPPDTFSIAFDSAEFDESAHQRAVARAFGTNHHELRCSAADIGRVFPDVVWHAESPLVRTAPAPLFLLSRMVRDAGCRVVLTGEGADEVFGGYDIFKEAKVRRYWAAAPTSRRRAALVGRLYPYMPSLHRQPAEYLQRFFAATPDDLADPCFSHLPRWRVTSRLKSLLSDDLRALVADYDGRADLVAALPREYATWDPFCRSQYLEMAHLLPGYLLSSQGDRMAMAHAVETRYPFLDPHVVAFGSTLPFAMKMRALDEKHLLKRVARAVVPEVPPRSKQPYRAPSAAACFGADPDGYVDALLSADRVRRDGIFNPDAVARLVRKFRDGRAASARDDMALVGVLSTQLLVDRFVNHFPAGTHERSH